MLSTHCQEPQVIVYHCGGFTVADKDQKHPASLDYLKVFVERKEVIGNIHENPELLKPC